MGVNKEDSRQIKELTFLRKLANRVNFNANSFNLLKNLLSAINSEVTPAFEMFPTDPLDRVLHIGSNTVSNPETSVRHSNQPINKQFPAFTSGTVTLPAASGGTITVSPSIVPNPVLTITANAFMVGLVECDSLGNLSITLGNEGATEALAIANFPGVNTKAFQIGLLIIQTVSGVVQNVTGGRILQFNGGGGASSGSSDGVDAPIPGYQWKETDTFDVLKTSTDSRVTSTGYTNATQNLGKDLYRLACDKSKTVAVSTGTSLTINSASNFTVQAGDIVYLTSGARSGQWRRIDIVGSQTGFTLDAAFSGGDAAGGDTLMVSQAVWTVDLVNAGSASEKTRARDQFSGNIVQIAIDYFDSLITDDNIPDFVDTARVIVSASNNGAVATTGVPTSDTFTPPFTRLPYPQQINDYVLNTPGTDERLFLAFFPNPSNGSVTTSANLLGYEANFEVEDTVINGGVLESAYCYTDSTGTPVNCTVLPVVAGKSRIQTSWAYVPTINPGDTEGQIRVYEEGKLVPRFVAGSTTDAYWKEVADPSTGVWNIIELHDNYSGLNISIEIVKSEGIVDSANTNTTRIVSLESDRNIATPSSAYPILATDGTILCNTSGASFAVTLPTAIGKLGKRYSIRKNTPDSNFVTLNTSLGQTIDQQSSGAIIIYGYGDTYTVESDGANWFYVSKFLSRQSAGMYLGSNQSIPNASLTQVDFTAANDINDGTIANTGTNNITIKYGGRYLIIGNLCYQANAAGQRYLFIYINGVEIWGTNHNCDGNFRDRLSVSGEYPLSPGDVVTMYTYQTSSGGLILDASTSSQSNLLSVDRTADKTPNGP